jgi:hypothetical protein
MKPLLFVLIAVLFGGHCTSASAQWNSHPVIVAGGCENLEYTQIVGFLAEYIPANQTYSKSKIATAGAMQSHYTIATALVTRAQECLADALELKELGDRLRKQQAILTSGTSMSGGQIRKQRKLTAEANEEIQLAARQLANLTPVQRDRFSKGTSTYLAGTYATGQLYKAMGAYAASTASDAKKQVDSNDGSILDKSVRTVNTGKEWVQATLKLRALSKNLHEHTIDLVRTGQFLRTYAEQRSVNLPSDATKRLSEVSDWT